MFKRESACLGAVKRALAILIGIAISQFTMAAETTMGDVIYQDGKFSHLANNASATILDVVVSPDPQGNWPSTLPDQNINSTGTTTVVVINSIEVKDTTTSYFQLSKPAIGMLTPGRHYIDIAGTAAGHVINVRQNINVIPQVNFAPDQSIVEGRTVALKAILDGDALQYPVMIPVSISSESTEDNAFVQLQANEIVINSGVEGKIDINISDDFAANASARKLVINMGAPTNAVSGTVSKHTINIIDASDAIKVNSVAAATDVKISQQYLNAGTIVSNNRGEITIKAENNDGSVLDGVNLDWSEANNVVLPTLSQDNLNISFDPLGIQPAVYSYNLVYLNDSNKKTNVRFKMIPKVPSLTNNDVDKDGVSDVDETFTDSNYNEIPDHLDRLKPAFVLQYALPPDAQFGSVTAPASEACCTVSMSNAFYAMSFFETTATRGYVERSSSNYVVNDTQSISLERKRGLQFVNSSPGLSLRTGALAFEWGVPGAAISPFSMLSDFGVVKNRASVTLNVQIHDILNFDVHGLSLLGDVVTVTFPAYKANVRNILIYRMVNGSATGPYTLAADSKNKIMSANDVFGICPPPDSPRYVNGLSIDATCIQLKIEDGSNFDSDHQKNGVVTFIGGPADYTFDNTIYLRVSNTVTSKYLELPGDGFYIDNFPQPLDSFEPYFILRDEQASDTIELPPADKSTKSTEVVRQSGSSGSLDWFGFVALCSVLWLFRMASVRHALFCKY